MAKSNEQIGIKPGGNEADELSALNTQTGRGGNRAQRLRRKMEASIEAKAKKRRSREVPASAAFKK